MFCQFKRATQKDLILWPNLCYSRTNWKHPSAKCSTWTLQKAFTGERLWNLTAYQSRAVKWAHKAANMTHLIQLHRCTTLVAGSHAMLSCRGQACVQVWNYVKRNQQNLRHKRWPMCCGFTERKQKLHPSPDYHGFVLTRCSPWTYPHLSHNICSICNSFTS